MFAELLSYFILLFVCSTSYGSNHCGRYDFPCNNGECIDAALWCDTESDCSDGSDEAYCKQARNSSDDPNNCPSHFFKCDDGPCIPVMGRCDGEKSCDDFSDEANCEQSQDHTSTTTLKGSDTKSKFDYEPDIPVENFMSADHVHSSLNKYQQSSAKDFSHEKEKARQWLLSQRREDFGWGAETPRALAALYLSDVQRPDKTEDMLMTKQLDVQLSLDISRNGTNGTEMTLADLALYINALMATCKDPMNFYGNNLIGVLRQRVNAAQNEGKHVNPAVYLSLCMNNVSSYADTRKLQEVFMSRNFGMSRIDIQALAVLSIACISKMSPHSSEQLYTDVKKLFLQKIRNNGFPGNVYEAALMKQALNEAMLNEENLVSDLMAFILKNQLSDGSFGGILATYLVLPVLSGRNLLNIDDHCFNKSDNGLTPLEVLKNMKRKKMFVQYSLNYGFPVEITQTLQIRVAEGTSFLDIMRLAQDINPKYRFMLDDRQDSPLVYSIGGVPNDAERGMFWTLHVASTNNRSAADVGRLVIYTGSIKHLIPKEGDEIVFWMKPV